MIVFQVVVHKSWQDTAHLVALFGSLSSWASSWPSEIFLENCGQSCKIFSVQSYSRSEVWVAKGVLCGLFQRHRTYKMQMGSKVMRRHLPCDTAIQLIKDIHSTWAHVLLHNDPSSLLEHFSTLSQIGNQLVICEMAETPLIPDQVVFGIIRCRRRPAF